MCFNRFGTLVLISVFITDISAAESYPEKVLPEDSILSEYVTFGPPNPNPPPYTLLRYNEQYSYLADPALRTDFFDPVKYIPLNPYNPESYVSFGGEIRERYENYVNQYFGTSYPVDNSYLLQRITLHADVHVNERIRFYVQGISGIQYGGQGMKPPVDQDPIDLQQAFADYIFGTPTPKGTRLTVRLGRLEMTYGSGRLVATRAAPNIPFKYDGLQLIGSKEDTTKLYGFIVRPDIEVTNHIDRENNAQAFWGLYGTRPIGGPIELSMDLYYLGFLNKKAQYASGSGPEHRQTIGMRFFGKPQGWDYDIETVVQFGTFGPMDIFAWTFASDIGYTFSSHAWKPRFGSKFDIASGDRNRYDNKLGTFNPLFFKAGYFNDASVIKPANVMDIHPSLQFEPFKEITVTLGSDILWRATTQDAIYAPPGNIELPAGIGKHYVATSSEAAMQWQFNRHIVWTVSYVHMFTGSYVQLAKGGDVNFLGSWVTFTW